MDWALERINAPKKTFFNLESSASSYSCGRAYGSAILCRSLLVSRKHCIFVRDNRGWHVRDLKSGNGTYVNGKCIKPGVLVGLHENDLIGIGHANGIIDANMRQEDYYTFRLNRGNVVVINPSCAIDEELTQVSSRPTDEQEVACDDRKANKRIVDSTETPGCKASKISKKEKEIVCLSDSDSDISDATHSRVEAEPEINRSKKSPTLVSDCGKRETKISEKSIASKIQDLKISNGLPAIRKPEMTRRISLFNHDKRKQRQEHAPVTSTTKISANIKLWLSKHPPLSRTFSSTTNYIECESSESNTSVKDESIDDRFTVPTAIDIPSRKKLVRNIPGEISSNAVPSSSSGSDTTPSPKRKLSDSTLSSDADHIGRNFGAEVSPSNSNESTLNETTKSQVKEKTPDSSFSSVNKGLPGRKIAKGVPLSSVQPTPRTLQMNSSMTEPSIRRDSCPSDFPIKRSSLPASIEKSLAENSHCTATIRHGVDTPRAQINSTNGSPFLPNSPRNDENAKSSNILRNQKTGLSVPQNSTSSGQPDDSKRRSNENKKHKVDPVLASKYDSIKLTETNDKSMTAKTKSVDSTNAISLNGSMRELDSSDSTSLATHTRETKTLKKEIKTEIKTEPSSSYCIDDIDILSHDGDDFFPSSQLFDSTEDVSVVFTSHQDATRVKEEVDEEKAASWERHDMEEVIVLSDSEDEENPWLTRLLHGQQQIKQEIPDEEPQHLDLGLDNIDSLFPIKTDEIDIPEDVPVPSTSPVSIPYLREHVMPFKVESEHDEPLESPEPSEPRDDPKIGSNIEAKASVKLDPKFEPPHCPESFMSPELVKSLETTRISEEQENSPKDSHSSDAPQKFEPHEEPLKNKETNKILAKGPELIEPLRMMPRKGQKMLLTAGDSSPIASTSQAPPKLKDCSVKVNRLSVKQRKELEKMDKVLQRQHDREQKLRRLKNKWMQNIPPLPSGMRKVVSTNKKEKLEMVHERKEKLKELATKSKADITEPTLKRAAVKPKIKVSEKNRGHFLIQEEKNGGPSVSDPIGSSQSSNSVPPSKVGTVEKEKARGTSRKSAPCRSGETESVKKSNRAKSPIAKLKIKKKKHSDTEIVVESPLACLEENVCVTNRTSTSDRPTVTIRRTPLEPLKPILCRKQHIPSNSKIKKRVSFAPNLQTIQTYQIDHRNDMKKCTGKDKPMPTLNLCSQNPRSECLQLEEFLFDVFGWIPKWLEEQKNCSTEPPVIGKNTLIPLLTSYKSYKDYYRVLKPLLLLELWHTISKEYFASLKSDRYQTMFCSIVSNTISAQKVKGTDSSLSSMIIQVLASQKDLHMKNHPVFGDLLIIELCYGRGDVTKQFLRVFAYVTQIHRSIITPHTLFNRDLLTHVPNAHTILTYTILTKQIKYDVLTNRVLRLKRVTYLRSDMRMVQAVQALQNSPLLRLIIEPNADDYRLPEVVTEQNLVSRDKLNKKQSEAVLRTTEAVVQPESKICLIQGPPGTGKSMVIVNMIMQILYGNNRYKSKKPCAQRILLCAPSNAAIDEVVLRLLKLREKLTNDQFKMVRVGRVDTMHPIVRNISLETLAKRDIKRNVAALHTSYDSISSIEDEKRFLEGRINAMQEEMKSAERRKMNCDYLKIKITETKAKYDLLSQCQPNIDPREYTKRQRNTEIQILTHADIIACTLSSCYTNLMETVFGGGKNNISVCIVDEATQSCEAETLIPLMLGIKHLVLVGDPNQLSATIISQQAKKWGMEQSLFLRIQRAFELDPNDPVIMLNTQYRMDQQICHWPNKFFYRGKLQCAIGRRCVLPFHPYRVLNLDSVQNTDKFTNTNEAEFVANLISGLTKLLIAKKIQIPVSIAVITPYQNQKSLLQSRIDHKLTSTMEMSKTKITTEVNTVDSFQGQERDVVIMSCVRSNGIGFLSDPQRLCVALTRAKYSLILCGNFGTFQRDAGWNALLSDAKSRQLYFNVNANATTEDIMSNVMR